MKPDVIDLQYIADCLPEEILLDQLVEECTELAQAAAKVARLIRKVNPARTTMEEATANLKEETADIWLTLKVLGLDDEVFTEEYQQAMARKAKRWAHDLEAAE